MNPHKPTSEHIEIAEKVRSGEYFNEARSMYDSLIHDPMAERYWFALITVISVLIALVGMVAINGLFPLQRSVPFIYSINDIVDDLPRMRSLLAEKGDDPSEALLFYMVKNYIGLRESYDIDTFDRNIGGIKSQSTAEVFKEYQQMIDPRNPQSPVTLYQRHSRRTVEVVSLVRSEENPSEIQMEILATVASKTDVKKSRWLINVAFQYNGLALDSKTDKAKPIEFVITSYKSRPIDS